jgi:hypothetical protein
VAEWFKAAVLKTAVGASLPWVRIPPLPPTLFDFIEFSLIIFDASYFASYFLVRLRVVDF